MALNQYLKEIREYPTLTPEEKKEVWENPTHENMDKLILSNLRLVIYIAKKLYPYNGTLNYEQNLEYLIQEGNSGLLYATTKFDPSKGFEFTTYAYNWIAAYIQRAIFTHMQGIVRKPVHIMDQIILVYKTKVKLMQQMGDEPSPEEISEALDSELSPMKVQELLDISSNELSLDQAYNDEENDSPLINAIGDDSTVQEIHHNEWKTLLMEAINEELTPILRVVISARYGIGEFEDDPQTLDTTAQICYEKGLTKEPLSRERIRQLENKAIELLRKNPSIRDLIKDK